MERLRRDDTVYRSHDSNGNLTSANATTMAYDYRNGLAEVKQGQTTIGDYEYDVFGRRTLKFCETTRYCYDGDQAVQLYDGSGNLTRTFVFGQWRDGPQLMYALDYSDYNGNSNTSETLLFTVHSDVWCTTRFVAGPDQEVAEQYDVSRFGETTIRAPDGTNLEGTSAIHNPCIWRGFVRDEETALIWTAYGHYDPPVGRLCEERAPVPLPKQVPNQPFADSDDWWKKMAAAYPTGTSIYKDVHG